MVMSPTVKLRLIADSLRSSEAGETLRRWRHGVLDRRPLHHLFVECSGLRKRLAPAAIGKAEIRIAECTGQRNLRDVERPGESLRPRLEQGKALPGAVPLVVEPDLPALLLRPQHLFVAAQQHRFEHALNDRVFGLSLPAIWTTRR